jgi:hypothetical protein
VAGTMALVSAHKFVTSRFFGINYQK